MRHNQKSNYTNFSIVVVISLISILTVLSYASDPKVELKRRCSAYQAMAEAKFSNNLLIAGEDTNLQKIAQATFELDQSKINAWYNKIEAKFRLIEKEYDFTNKEKNDLCMIVLSKSQDPISIPIATYEIDSQTEKFGKRPQIDTEICNMGNEESPLTIHSANLPLECIFYSEEKPEAIVDGTIVHEGDTIRWKKILRIYEDSIEFENDGNIFRQHIYDVQENEYTIKKETDYKSQVLPSSYEHIQNKFLPIKTDEKEPQRPNSHLASADDATEVLLNNYVLVQNPKFEKGTYQALSRTENSEDRGKYIGQYSVNQFVPNSISNSFGAGSQFRPDSINNKFGKYGSEFSPYSARNPYSTHAPKLYDSKGNYRGRLSNNCFDPDSISNQFGRYGSSFSPDSVNNPFGAGNPFSTDSPNNKFGQGLSIYGDN